MTAVDLQEDLADFATNVDLRTEIAGVRADMDGLERRLHRCEGNAMKNRINGSPRRELIILSDLLCVMLGFALAILVLPWP
ncbi:MAG: hypothetical protein GDA52_04660 [Rhodobacteraceae bacterium]|nr:hypothetical protein [Paracoccaceae bacterium]